MKHPLDGARAKTQRSRGHLDELRTAVAQFLAGTPYPVIDEIDPANGERLVRIPGPLPELPLAWSTVLGDLVHNARSALDYVVAELNVAAGQDPRADRTQFPIADTEEAYLKFRNRHLTGVPEEQRRRIDALQPFHQRRPLAEPLSLLAWMSNADKHRALVAGYSAIHLPQLTLSFPSTHMRVSDLCVRFKRLPGATEFEITGDFKFASDAPEDRDIVVSPGNRQPSERATIAFSERAVTLTQLERVVANVESALTRFEAAF